MFLLVQEEGLELLEVLLLVELNVLDKPLEKWVKIGVVLQWTPEGVLLVELELLEVLLLVELELLEVLLLVELNVLDKPLEKWVKIGVVLQWMPEGVLLALLGRQEELS